MHDDVVRAVELLVLIFRRDRRNRSVLLEAVNRAAAPAGDRQPSFLVERHAVRVPRGTQHDFAPDARLPFPDGVADDVNPVQLTGTLVPHGTFAEGQALLDAVERRIAIVDPLETRRD